MVTPRDTRIPIAATLRSGRPAAGSGLAADPHPAAPLDPGRGQPGVGAGPDQRLLDRPHVGDHVDRLAEPDDRVPDELAGAVPGDLAAPVHLDHRARPRRPPAGPAGWSACPRCTPAGAPAAGRCPGSRRSPAARAAAAAGPSRAGRGRLGAEAGVHVDQLAPHAAHDIPAPPAQPAGDLPAKPPAASAGKQSARWGSYRAREVLRVINVDELRRMSPGERAEAVPAALAAPCDDPGAAGRAPDLPGQPAPPGHRAGRHHRLLPGAGRLDRRARASRCPATTARAAGGAPGSGFDLGLLVTFAVTAWAGLAAPPAGDHLPGGAGHPAVLRRLVRRHPGPADQRVPGQPADGAVRRAAAGRAGGHRRPPPDAAEHPDRLAAAPRRRGRCRRCGRSRSTAWRRAASAPLIPAEPCFPAEAAAAGRRGQRTAARRAGVPARCCRQPAVRRRSRRRPARPPGRRQVRAG